MPSGNCLPAVVVSVQAYTQQLEYSIPTPRKKAFFSSNLEMTNRSPVTVFFIVGIPTLARMGPMWGLRWFYSCDQSYDIANVNTYVEQSVAEFMCMINP